MRTCLRLELRKIFRSGWFWLVMGIAIGISCLNTMEMIRLTKDSIELSSLTMIEQKEYMVLSIFTKWIGCDSFTLGFSLYFFLFPLFATFAYGWSFFQEKKSGYIKNLITRTTRKNYYWAKYISVFIAGGLSMTVPMLINMFLTATFSNLNTPDVVYTYFSMMHGSFGSELFYSHPFLFSVLYLFIDFIFCGLIACMSMALSFFIKNRLAVLLIPFFFLLILDYLSNFLMMEIFHTEYDISVMRFLHPTPFPWYISGWIILGYGVLFTILTMGICIKKGTSSNVF